jgi:hypothetical protein
MKQISPAKRMFNSTVSKNMSKLDLKHPHMKHKRMVAIAMNQAEDSMDKKAFVQGMQAGFNDFLKLALRIEDDSKSGIGGIVKPVLKTGIGAGLGAAAGHYGTNIAGANLGRTKTLDLAGKHLGAKSQLTPKGKVPVKGSFKALRGKAGLAGGIVGGGLAALSSL